MLQIAYAAAGHNRYVHCVGNSARECKIIAVACTITVHARDKQFTCTEFGELHRMLQRIDARGISSAMGEDLPSVAGPARIN